MRHKAEINDLRSQIQHLLDENATLQSQSRTTENNRNDNIVLLETAFFRDWNKKNPNKMNMRGGQSYYYPVGFFEIRFRILNFNQNTIVAYHGTRISCIPSILKNGFKLPSELGLRSNFLLEQTFFGIQNYPNAIFVSPSIKYASLYGIQENAPLDEYYIILLQVRVKPNSYTMHSNTTNYNVNDPHYNDDQIEWRIANPKDVFPYSVLVKTISANEMRQLYNKKNK